MTGPIWGHENLDPFPYLPRGWSAHNQSWLKSRGAAPPRVTLNTLSGWLFCFVFLIKLPKSFACIFCYSSERAPAPRVG